MSDVHPMPESLGEFRLWPPQPEKGKTGWTLSWSGVWMPGSYADYNAVVLIAGLVLGAPLNDGMDLMKRLEERHNRSVPGEDITVRHIVELWSPDYQ